MCDYLHELLSKHKLHVLNISAVTLKHWLIHSSGSTCVCEWQCLCVCVWVWFLWVKIPLPPLFPWCFTLTSTQVLFPKLKQIVIFFYFWTSRVFKRRKHLNSTCEPFSPVRLCPQSPVNKVIIIHLWISPHISFISTSRGNRPLLSSDTSFLISCYFMTVFTHQSTCLVSAQTGSLETSHQVQEGEGGREGGDWEGGRRVKLSFKTSIHSHF